MSESLSDCESPATARDVDRLAGDRQALAVAPFEHARLRVPGQDPRALDAFVVLRQQRRCLFDRVARVGAAAEQASRPREQAQQFDDAVGLALAVDLRDRPDEHRLGACVVAVVDARFPGAAEQPRAVGP